MIGTDHGELDGPQSAKSELNCISHEYSNIDLLMVSFGADIFDFVTDREWRDKIFKHLNP